MSIWIFTGLTMIIEGVFDAAAMVVQLKKQKATGNMTETPV